VKSPLLLTTEFHTSGGMKQADIQTCVMRNRHYFCCVLWTHKTFKNCVFCCVLWHRRMQ